ncbi:hypothetical protein EYF80_058563 [Liparis tanakae]|uniref:Uncharacterized protein n=1 Tax=Liparis tanakae TaxID=230148 RepID=A0A4Z2EQV5_9TELE|nr:hypothetical protein EYF80_058563 [Liparis tanakae]
MCLLHVCGMLPASSFWPRPGLLPIGPASFSVPPASKADLIGLASFAMPHAWWAGLLPPLPAAMALLMLN